MARQIMRSFRIDEISGVDSPAQKHAVVAIMKRDLSTDLLPDGWVSKNTPTKGEGDMDPKEIQKAIDAAVATATADIAKKLADSEAAVAALKKAKTSAADAEDPKDGGADDAEENAFGQKTKKFVDAVAKAAANDEILKVGDVEIRKSAVGDANFAIFKAQQAEIVKANDAREIVELTKRAETEFGNLPGEPIAKAKVLKAVAAMPEADRTELEKMLKAGNAALKGHMKPIGKDGGVDATASDQLDALAKAHAEKTSVSFAKAYDTVLQTEQGRSLYKAMTAAKAA